MTVSRQRKWQIKQIEAGRCVTCGAKATNKFYCDAHHASTNERQRNAYRLKKGIPLDAPLHTRANNE